MRREDELSQHLRQFQSARTKTTSAKQIQGRIKTYLAQEKMLVLWEKNFYDIMARTIQTKIKQYLTMAKFEQYTRGNR